MKRTIESVVFAGLASSILLGLSLLVPQRGATASGAGGEELISIKAASARIVEMVETWERPPLTQAQVTTDPAPLTLEEAPPPPSIQIKLSKAPRAEIKLALSQPIVENQPDFESLTVNPVISILQPQELRHLSQPTQSQLPPKVASSPPAQVQPTTRPPKLNQTPQDVLEVDTTTASTPPPKPKAAPKPAPRSKPQVQPETGTKAEVASAGRAKQRAAGNGGGSQAGAAGAYQASSLSPGRRAKLKNVWGAKIRARIERRKRYPSGAKGNAIVVIRLTVSRDGRLMNYKIAKSSGNAAFDQAAILAVKRAGRFPAAPKKLPDQKFMINLPIDFSQ